MSSNPSTASRVGAFIAWLLVTFLAAVPGAVWSPGSWYEELTKPSWTPPDVLFPVVWTALYFLMACAAWRVWRVASWGGTRGALTLYLFQLACNAAWTPVFFGAHRIGAGFAVIVVLWLAILATLVAFRRHDRLAAWMLTPYLAWVSYAAALNAALWRLN